MASIDQIVSITVSQQTTSPALTSFAIPLILGASGRITGALYGLYSQPSDLIAAGFLLTDPEYIRAVALCSQTNRPATFAVGKYTNSASMVADIQAIQAVYDGWYALIICSQLAADILAVAAYIETQTKIFIADTNDAAVLTGVTTDVGSQLQAFSYKRTALLYSGVAGAPAAAAWVGGVLPFPPGSASWKFKTLVGVLPDNLSAGQRAACVGPGSGVAGKNVNIYETIAGRGVTEEGFMAGGQFIDITVGLDWLTSTMKNNIYGLLGGANKTPYTDAGAELIRSGIGQTLQQGVDAKFLDGTQGMSVTVPSIASLPQSSKANRVLTGVTFSCRLSGAFHFVTVNGTVTI
jgi:hypothetical protein